MFSYKWLAVVPAVVLPGCVFALLSTEPAEATPGSYREVEYFSDPGKTQLVGFGRTSCQSGFMQMEWGYQTSYWTKVWEESCGHGGGGGECGELAWCDPGWECQGGFCVRGAGG